MFHTVVQRGFFVTRVSLDGKVPVKFGSYPKSGPDSPDGSQRCLSAVVFVSLFSYEQLNKD